MGSNVTPGDKISAHISAASVAAKAAAAGGRRQHLQAYSQTQHAPQDESHRNTGIFELNNITYCKIYRIHITRVNGGVLFLIIYTYVVY